MGTITTTTTNTTTVTTVSYCIPSFLSHSFGHFYRLFLLLFSFGVKWIPFFWINMITRTTERRKLNIWRFLVVIANLSYRSCKSFLPSFFQLFILFGLLFDKYLSFYFSLFLLYLSFLPTYLYRSLHWYDFVSEFDESTEPKMNGNSFDGLYQSIFSILTSLLAQPHFSKKRREYNLERVPSVIEMLKNESLKVEMDEEKLVLKAVLMEPKRSKKFKVQSKPKKKSQ